MSEVTTLKTTAALEKLVDSVDRETAKAAKKAFTIRPFANVPEAEIHTFDEALQIARKTATIDRPVYILEVVKKVAVTLPEPTVSDY